MTMSQLTGSYGESNAIRLVPMGWTPAAGQSYTVTVTRHQHADQLHRRLRRLPVARAQAPAVALALVRRVLTVGT